MRISTKGSVGRADALHEYQREVPDIGKRDNAGHGFLEIRRVSEEEGVEE